MVSTTDEIISETPAVEINNEIIQISEEDFEKAQKTFQLGKKNLFLNKYDESVNNIGEACKVYTTKFGEFDSNCAELYFYYGRALLELARVENTVLGNALNGVPEDTGPIDDSRYGNPEELQPEEKKEISEQVIDALCSTDEERKQEETIEAKPESETVPIAESEVASTTETPAPITETPAPATETITSTEPKETNGEAATGEAGEEEEDDEEEEEEEEDITKNEEQAKDEAEAEEISNLQRAWEMFELAKLVYSKNFDNDVSFKSKRIAECLLKLGEISVEQEIYDQAINDIGESIRLQEELKEQRDERMLAESFYQLGLSQQFSNLFNEANESYQKSINIMQLRIEKLKGKLESIGNEADNEAERNTIKDEIAELETLLPEMQAKLEEVNEQGQQSLNLIKEAKECMTATVEATLGQPAINGGEIKDITCMVKSKRKINEVTEDDSNQKKTKLNETDEQTNQNTDEPVSMDEQAPQETPAVTEAVANA